mmetsp:Transcript_119428/g.207364  ORF Transcript_119428/g.207364 Transcript_119428/m.207364 type:complete len:338 (-) Transcript_119428:162-1175(-)
MAMAVAQGSDAAACNSIPEDSTQGMCTPVMKPKREPLGFPLPGNFSMLDSSEMKFNRRKVSEDDISTAAPSPWTGSEFDSPWPSPFPTPGTGKQRGHAQPASIILPDMIPTIDFHALSGALPQPTACMISPASPEVDQKLCMSPIATPRSKKAPPTTPPPRPVLQVSELMQALMSKSVELVRSALLDDPFAAQRPLLEKYEPPLCAAVRLENGPDIIELLLDYGADVNAADCNGQTPLRILRTHLKLFKFEVDVLGAKGLEPPRNLCRVEELLVQAQVQTGVLADDLAGDQGSDMDMNSSPWVKLLTEPPPPVNNIDLFEHFMNTTAFASQPALITY